MVHHQWSWRKRRRRRGGEDHPDRDPDPPGTLGTTLGTVPSPVVPEEARVSARLQGEEELLQRLSNALGERIGRGSFESGASYCDGTTPMNLTGGRSASDGRSNPHERIREQRSTYTRHQRYHSPRGGGSTLSSSPLFLLKRLLLFLPSSSLLLFLLSLSALLPSGSARQDNCTWTLKPWSAFDPVPTPSPNEIMTMVDPRTCFLWTSEIPSVLCAASGKERLRRMGMVHLFNSSTLSDVTLLDYTMGKKSPASSAHLRPGVEGRDCVEGNADQCLKCFRRLDYRMEKLNEAQTKFEMALDRFDCLPATDTATATRPFSPNASCLVCKMWYKRWLTSQYIDLWRDGPCIDWCYSAQLACPHLATSRVVDYAGHPSFQCTDLNIPLSGSAATCACVHPCDIKGIIIADDSLATFDMCARRAESCAAAAAAPPPSPPAATSSSSAAVRPSPLLLLPLLALLLSQWQPAPAP